MLYWNQPPKDDGTERPKKEADNCQIKQRVYLGDLWTEAEALAAARWCISAPKGNESFLYSLQEYRWLVAKWLNFFKSCIFQSSKQFNEHTYLCKNIPFG